MTTQKIRHMMSFEMYPESAVQLMLDTAVGKPFRDSDGYIIGKIIEVSRTENPKVLEFISEVHLEEVKVSEGKSVSVVSIDERREK
jgi:hypothetical protein